MLPRSHVTLRWFSEYHIHNVVEEICFAMLTAEVLERRMSAAEVQIDEEVVTTYTTEDIFLSRKVSFAILAAVDSSRRAEVDIVDDTHDVVLSVARSRALCCL
jgi:hypothetical protein